jgi:hypothetical protein
MVQSLQGIGKIAEYKGIGITGAMPHCYYTIDVKQKCPGKPGHHLKKIVINTCSYYNYFRC